MEIRSLDPTDAEALAAWHATYEASGRTKCTTVAIAEEGAVVAYTDLVQTSHGGPPRPPRAPAGARGEGAQPAAVPGDALTGPSRSG